MRIRSRHIRGLAGMDSRLPFICYGMWPYVRPRASTNNVSAWLTRGPWMPLKFSSLVGRYRKNHLVYSRGRHSLPRLVKRNNAGGPSTLLNFVTLSYEVVNGYTANHVGYTPMVCTHRWVIEIIFWFICRCFFFLCNWYLFLLFVIKFSSPYAGHFYKNSKINFFMLNLFLYLSLGDVQFNMTIQKISEVTFSRIPRVR